MEINTSEMFRIKNELNGLAEQSGMEYNTSDYIIRELKNLSTTKIYELENSCSILAVFETDRIGKTLLFRGDIDAIIFNGEYRHLCGHDGHTTMLLTLAKEIDSEIEKLNGTIILLFQAAEETGKGAKEVILSGVLNNYQIDYLFAMHNLPGFPVKSVVISNDTFAKASSGIKIDLISQSTHASNPVVGQPMDYYLFCVTNLLYKIADVLNKENNRVQFNITYINFGLPNFGTIQNTASIYGVVRSNHTEEIDEYKDRLINELNNILSESNIEFKLEYLEEFPATVNSQNCVNILKNALNYPMIEISEPFPWSEDFGHFSKIGDICLFGMGIGESASGLHTEAYSFPKECLITGVNILESILLETNKIVDL